VFVNASWADDLTTPTETLRWRNAVLSRWPHAEVDVLLSDGAGHPRAAITGVTPGLAPLQHAFWDRLLKGAQGRRLGIRTLTQACNGDQVLGPFTTATWAAQHPGEVRYRETAPKQVSSPGDPATGLITDPVANIATGSCVTTEATDAPSSATYRLPPATGSGYTVLGSPTVVARIAASGPSAQLAARLWDVAPDGRQTLMARLAYRPRLDDARPQVFQLHPTGWHIAEGHVVKLELLSADQPYVRASNGAFDLTVSDLELRLPVRERPRSAPGVHRPAPLLARNGKQLPAKQRFRERTQRN
jgi:predicted acyl esterase